MKDRKRRRRKAEGVVSDAAGAGAGALVGGIVGGPVGIVAGAVLGPVFSEGIHQTIRVAVERSAANQWQRSADVIRLASAEAALEPEILVHRLEASESGEELFVRTLRAASDTPTRRKLVLLSRALASGAAAADESAVAWEVIFVKAVAAIDESHLNLLERFRWSPNQLGLGDGSQEFDAPIMGMNSVQITRVVPQFEPVIDSLIGTLEGQGLLIRLDPPAGGIGGGRNEIRSWVLSPFGIALLDRLDDVGRTLRNW